VIPRNGKITGEEATMLKSQNAVSEEKLTTGSDDSNQHASPRGEISNERGNDV